MLPSEFVPYRGLCLITVMLSKELRYIRYEAKIFVEVRTTEQGGYDDNSLLNQALNPRVRTDGPRREDISPNQARISLKNRIRSR